MLIFPESKIILLDVLVVTVFSQSFQIPVLVTSTTHGYITPVYTFSL